MAGPKPIQTIGETASNATPQNAAAPGQFQRVTSQFQMENMDRNVCGHYPTTKRHFGRIVTCVFI
jgi:hypothetical protein